MSDSLKALSTDLQQAIDCYTDTSGPDGFAQRKKIIALAQEIINDVKDPHEKPFDYCVSVSQFPPPPHPSRRAVPVTEL